MTTTPSVKSEMLSRLDTLLNDHARITERAEEAEREARRARTNLSLMQVLIDEYRAALLNQYGVDTQSPRPPRSSTPGAQV